MRVLLTLSILYTTVVSATLSSRLPLDSSNLLQEATNLLTTLISQTDSTSGTISLRERHLALGDFETFNNLFRSATLSLPDAQVSTKAVGITLNMDITNLRCTNVGVGDILITYQKESNQRLTYGIEIVDLDITCYLDFRFSYGFFHGNGQADAFTDNNQAKTTLAFASTDFDASPPSSSAVEFCEALINIVDLDMRGDFIVSIANTFEALIRGTIETQVQNVACEQLQSLGGDFGTNYLALAKKTLDPYLTALSTQDADPLYAENNLAIPPAIRLMDFGDKDNVVVGWFHTAVNMSGELLGTMKLETQDLGINTFLRQTFLDADRALVVKVDSFVENAQLYNAQDKLTATTITVESVKIFGLDTLTRFAPLSDVGRYTLTNELSWEFITIEMELIIDIKASTRDDSILSDPSSTGIAEKIKIVFGVDKVDAVVSLLLAIDQDILGNLELGSLLTTENIAPCLLASLFQVNVTALNVNVSNIREPVLSGFISAGMDRFVTETVNTAFIMYEATILQALPNVFQTTIKDVVNENIIRKYLTTEGNADCPLVTFGEGPIDFRDFFLKPNASVVIGGTGKAQYGNLGSTLKALLQDQLLSVDSDGLPKLNSFLVRPLTESQSGVPGSLRFPDKLFSVAKDDMTNPLVLAFIQRFRLEASDVRITNLDTISSPLVILEPSSDPSVITNTLALGPVSGKDLNASMQLLWAIEGKDSPLDMRHVFDISLSIPSSSIVADLRAMMDGVALSNFPLKDLLEIDCWLATFPAVILNSEGKRSDSNEISPLGLANFLMKLTDLSVGIDCVTCSSSGVSILPEILQLQRSMGSWKIFSQRMENFVMDLITSDWFQLQIDRLISNAPKQCPHSALFDKTGNPTKYSALLIPNLSREAVETVVFAGGLGAELAILAFAETHLGMNSVPTDPLGPQANLSPAVRASSLNWTDLSGTIGRFAHVALDEARGYLGGMVGDKERGNEDLGLNVLLRKYFLDEDGSWTIPLDDVGFAEVGINLSLPSIRITGLDTLKQAILFGPMDAQTVKNELQFGKLAIELDLMIDTEEEMGSPENMTISISLENLYLAVPLLLAVRSDKIEEMKLGSLLRTEDILPCILASVDALEVTQLVASAESFNATITGFLASSIQNSLNESLKTTVDTYQAKILSAIPAVFQETARGLLNRIISAYIADDKNTVCPVHPSVSEESLIDFRDLFLPKVDALKAGGKGDSPYGTLAVLIKQLLNTEFLDSGSEKGVARINDAIVRPLTKAQSGINGTFLVEGEIGSLSIHDAVQFGINSIQLAFSNITISNLDTVGSPFVILEPNTTKGTLLNNKAVLALDSEPLYGSLKLLLALTGDPALSMRNEIAVGLELSEIEAIAVLMVRMRENGLFDFPLRDIANFDCWLATLARPDLDESGLRIPGLEPGLVLDYLSLAVQVLHLNFTCVSCTSSGLASLPEVMNTLIDAGTVEDLQPRLLGLSSDLLESDYVQVLLDRLLIRASQKCPHSPDFAGNATAIKDYKGPRLPELTRESVESVIYAATVVVESMAVLLAKSHEYMVIADRDPLSGQSELNVSGNVRLVDFSSLDEAVGSWADSALEEAYKYLGGEVRDTNGSKDLGINVFMRSALLNSDGSLPITFDDLSISEGEMKIGLKQIRISGLDTFTTFNAFDAIAPQTLQNRFGWKELGLALDISIKLDSESTSDSRMLAEAETLTILFGVKDIDLSLAMLLAVDRDILGALQMGSMLKTSKILPCLLSASKGVDITELTVSIGAISGLSFMGFLSQEVDQAITRSTNALLDKYRDTLVNTMPVIFDSTVRTLANNWLSYYLNADTSATCAVPARSGAGLVDFRDLLLPEQKSRSLGGSGDRQYGNLFQSVLGIVNERVLTIDEADGTSAVNSLLVAPLTNSQSSVPGTFRYKGDLFSTGTRIAVGGFDAKIELRAYDARIENLDSVGAPLSVLNPMLDLPYNLYSTASFGVGENPLRFAVRFLISLMGDKDIRLRNEVDISLDLSAATVAIDTLLKISETSFFNFPLGDIQNVHCWMATLPAPSLDSKGIRKPGSSLSAALANLAVSLKKLNLNITCVSCTSPEMNDLSKLLSTPEAVDDVTAVANTILDYATKLLGGEFLQFQIDRMLANAPARCPHSVEYQPNFVPAEYGAFEAVDGKEDSIKFFLTIAIVMGCLIAVTVCLSIVTKFIVKRRSRAWALTLSRERVNLIQQLQAAEQEREAELNYVTTSMFCSKDIPLWVRYVIPFVLVANVGFFLSGHLNLGASVNIVAELAGEKITVENFFEFSMAQSTIDIWRAGGKQLAILIILFSGIWPYTKQFVTLALWFLPPKRVSCTLRGNIFLWLDALAKWSMVDIFVLIVSITAFRVTIESPDVGFLPDDFYSINLLVVPRWGLYANMIAQIMSQINSHFIIHYHRRMIESASRSYDRRVIGGSPEGGWNDDEDQIVSPGSNVHHIDETKSNIQNHAFSRPHRGESDKLQVQTWVNKCLVFVSMLLSLLVLIGCILPSFSLEVLGILGVVVESGQQFEQAVVHHGVFTIIQMLMDEARFLGGANNYIGLASLSILLILTVLVVPMVQAMVLLRQWFTPLTRRQRNRISILLESLQAWQYAEVYVISLLVAAWQLGPVSEFMINSYCDSLSNTFATLVYFGILAEEDAQCFRVQASIESSTYLLITAAILLAILNSFVMRAVHQYEFDNSAIVQSLKYATSVVQGVEEAPVDENKVDQARANIRPVPVLFTDSYRWVCRRQDRGLPRVSLNEFDDDAKLGIAETFVMSAMSGMEEIALERTGELKPSNGILAAPRADFD